ncbi:Membrane protein [[Clostridium] ultunense Esp]|uniref:Membrane protein n=1 Tax=[Clostridium] ultunense Esp TaxID=1288971 RepID=M1Z7H4_9FIRM|nr:lysoplasmalogenase family protein [Schnuerera ultunensis]CCQ93674.1 Membrane protein [[Clostridium] ultunense Esp]SHD77822.1 Membrane protein [[Clostridium] ultunense Esp]
MLKTIHKWRIIKVFLLFIAILYIGFMYIDIYDIESIISSDRLKYLSMLLVLMISLFTGDDALNVKDLKLLQTGLFITLIADLFLLILGRHYVLGILLFSVVQIIYSSRYGFTNLKINIRNFIVIFSSLFIVHLVVDKLIFKLDFIWVMGLFYGLCLLNSVIKAAKAYRDRLFPKPNGHMILIGMVLFLLCDINVALYNILNEGLFYNISSISMWLFYLPSQVLLSLSGYKYNLK